MEFSELELFLTKTHIPTVQSNIGFLEIIRKQHHENINSSIYAHFINSHDEGVKSVFSEALFEIIEKKTDKKIAITNAFAQTEVSTGNGRIDILISDASGEQTIIIENKIRHWLDNDLNDYWNFVKIDEGSKIGILLTLEPHISELPDGFISITHKEWITGVKNKIVSYELPTNYSVYIHDFIHTIENLSKNYKMNESAKFYFNNATQVLKAQNTINEAYTFLNNQLDIVSKELGWNPFGNSMNWRNFWDEANNIDTYLTIITKEIINGNFQFTLIIELNRLDKDREEDVRQLLSNHPQLNGKYRGESVGSYVHFLCANYPVSFEELGSFGQVIVEKIRKDFGDILITIIEYLYPNKDISSWRDNFKVTINC